MSGLQLRRIVAALAALTWPACRVFETIAHPWWGTKLSDAMAPLVAMVILALVVTSPAAHRDRPRAKHTRTPAPAMELVLAQLLRLSGRVSDLQAGQRHCEARHEHAEARQELTEARLGCAMQVINEANEAAGLPAPDVDDTLPGTRKLRAVRPLGGRQAG